MRALLPDEIDVVANRRPRKPNWFGFILAALFAVGLARGCTRANAAECHASWYGSECAGRPQANGKPFDPAALTVASWDYPLGTRLRVTHDGRSVIVTVTDRGPARRLYRRGRKLDLSKAAFARLSDCNAGVISVTYERLK